MERGKEGQLASTIRQASDMLYITARDSQTNERGAGMLIQVGQFYNPPATLITARAFDTRLFIVLCSESLLVHVLLSWPSCFCQKMSEAHICHAKHEPLVNHAFL